MTEHTVLRYDAHVSEPIRNSDEGSIRMSDNRKVGEGMKERIDRHKDGSIKAKGHMMDGELEGYWEWFRLDAGEDRRGEREWQAATDSGGWRAAYRLSAQAAGK